MRARGQGSVFECSVERISEDVQFNLLASVKKYMDALHPCFFIHVFFIFQMRAEGRFGGRISAHQNDRLPEVVLIPYK